MRERLVLYGLKVCQTISMHVSQSAISSTGWVAEEAGDITRRVHSEIPARSTWVFCTSYTSYVGCRVCIKFHVDFLELQRDSRVTTGNSGCPVMLLFWLTKLISSVFQGHSRFVLSTSRKLGATMWAISWVMKREVMGDILSCKDQCVFWSHPFLTQWWGFCWFEFSSGFGWTELPCQSMLDIMSKKYTFIMWDFVLL